jgi:hypothetical protein
MGTKPALMTISISKTIEFLDSTRRFAHHQIFQFKIKKADDFSRRNLIESGKY